jgi:hypothetical protein
MIQLPLLGSNASPNTSINSTIAAQDDLTIKGDKLKYTCPYTTILKKNQTTQPILKSGAHQQLLNLVA